jgi:hypothetical protein
MKVVRDYVWVKALFICVLLCLYSSHSTSHTLLKESARKLRGLIVSIR